MTEETWLWIAVGVSFLTPIAALLICIITQHLHDRRNTIPWDEVKRRAGLE